MAKPSVVVACAGTDFQDWSALHGLLVECFAYMEGRIDPPSSLMRMPPNVLAAKARAETLLVAVANGILIGCGYLSEKEDAIHIGKLAVAPPFRRRGVLRALIDEADKLARRKGKLSLELQTRVELVENHQTFEALGFVKAGETAHPGFDRATSITMRKRVPPERPVPNGRRKAFHALAGTARRRALKAKACGLT